MAGLRLRYLFLFGGLLVAVLAYAYAWRSLAGEAEARIRRFADARTSEGYDVRIGAIERSGFPFRITLILDRPAMAAPPIGETGLRPWSFESERVRAVAMPWNLDHVIVAFEGVQDLRWLGPGGRALRGRARSAMMSAVRGPGGLDRLSLDIDEAILESPLLARPMTAKRFQLHIRREAPDAEGKAAVTAAAIADQLAPAEAAQGERLSSLTLARALVVLEAQAADEDALRTISRYWRPRPGSGVKVEELTLEWPEGRIYATGYVTLDTERRLAGELRVQINGPDRLVRAAQEDGIVDGPTGDAVAAAIAILGPLAGDSSGRLVLPVAFRDGRVFLGPAPIARLDPLY